LLEKEIIMAMCNEHQPTELLRIRVKDLAVAGIPHHVIAKIIRMDPETLRNHYSYELETGLATTVGDISRMVAMQALEGNEKSQALLLKTQGAKYGWVEKQVVENVNSEETQEMKEKIAALEGKYNKDY
jgi:hypothetical protein